MKRKRIYGLLLLGLLTALTAVGCVTAANPRGWAPPVAEDDFTAVTTRAGRLEGLDSQGRSLWRFPSFWNIPDGSAENLKGIYSAPVIAEDDSGKTVVFVGDYNGYVYAFRPGDFVDGETETSPPAASYKLDGPIVGGLTYNAATDTLYATSEDRVFSLRASDLIRRIENRDARVTAAVLLETGGEIWGTPVLADGKLLVGSLDGNLYAIDPVSGEEIWRYHADKGLVSTPTILGDRVLVSGFGSELFSINLDDGSLAWSFKAGHWIWARPAISGSTAYFGTFDGKIYAVSTSNGEELWSISPEKGVLRASPALVGNTLVVSSDDGWLLGIDTRSHDVVWQRDLNTALNGDMVVDGGTVLFAPNGCVTPEDGGDKVYYRGVNVTSGELSIASGVC